ncbi:hypothetical protein C3L33_01996, partial [Rhododendron williamsianum]
GELDDHEKLVSALGQVEVVISALAVPQHLEQLKIIAAIKQARNIKRFVPSEFGNEADRSSGLPPFQAIIENKRKIRRATEAAGIAYTLTLQTYRHFSYHVVVGVTLCAVLPVPENVQAAILHNIFVKGDQMSFQLTEDDWEASKLYPDYKYTSVNHLLDICLVNPPKPKLASFS